MKPLALFLAACALSLNAQDATIGARFHALASMGDLRDLTDGQIGLGAAAFVSISLNQGLVLRPLVGFQLIPKGDTLGLMGTKTSVTSVDLMVDALWFPNEDSEHGAYLLGSIGGHQWRVSSYGDTSSTLTYTRLGVHVGLGYQFTPRLGVEARGFWSPIKSNLTATGLLLGATVKF
jgi:hypothetical protein